MPEQFELNDMQPILYISSQNLPMLDFWEDGEEYEVDVKIKVKSITRRDGKKTTAELMIMSIDEKPPAEVSAMRHAEFKQAMADEVRKAAEAKGELA